MLFKFLSLTLAVILVGCRVSEFYTLKELRDQKVPDGLTNKIWRLNSITDSSDPDSIISTEFKSNDDECAFQYRFTENGRLLVFFKNHNLTGTYLINGNQFKYIDGGWKDKVVWTQDSECKVTPGNLSYIFYGTCDFKINTDSLTIKNNRGTVFVFFPVN